MEDGVLTVTRDQRHPNKLVLLCDGAYVCHLSWQAADELAKILTSTARYAEEYEKREKIIIQDALTARTGAPFSLTSRTPVGRKLRERAYNDAQWDTRIRKGMPLARKPSPLDVGPPRIIHHRKIL